jgi:hypothetical protein
VRVLCEKFPVQRRSKKASYDISARLHELQIDNDVSNIYIPKVMHILFFFLEASSSRNGIFSSYI